MVATRHLNLTPTCHAPKRKAEMRFLLIEDNARLAAAVVERLQLDGHAVDYASTLEAAAACMAVAQYDLILLDVMLPDGDGRDFLKRHRQASQRTPVIVLTARSAVSDRVGMLDLGADDYITKPFDFSELEARCRAVLRRQGGGRDNSRVLGDTRLDLTNACLLYTSDAADDLTRADGGGRRLTHQQK